jgi:SAM-dependent methyltransferase
MVNVVCFVNQPEDVFPEASRILKPGGRLIVAFIDRETELGQSYSSRSESKFYGAATFYSSAEIEAFFRKTRFISIQSCQTLFATPQLMQKPDLVLPGHGRGGFVVMSADKPSESS